MCMRTRRRTCRCTVCVECKCVVCSCACIRARACTIVCARSKGGMTCAVLAFEKLELSVPHAMLAYTHTHTPTHPYPYPYPPPHPPPPHHPSTHTNTHGYTWSHVRVEASIDLGCKHLRRRRHWNRRHWKDLRLEVRRGKGDGEARLEERGAQDGRGLGGSAARLVCPLPRRVAFALLLFMSKVSCSGQRGGGGGSKSRQVHGHELLRALIGCDFKAVAMYPSKRRLRVEKLGARSRMQVGRRRRRHGGPFSFQPRTGGEAWSASRLTARGLCGLVDGPCLFSIACMQARQTACYCHLLSCIIREIVRGVGWRILHMPRLCMRCMRCRLAQICRISCIWCVGRGVFLRRRAACLL